MKDKEIPIEQRLELFRLCSYCSSKQYKKCESKHGNLINYICLRKKVAFKIAESEYKRRLKKGEIK